VTLLQVWLFVGIPALALATAMFVGRSRWRSLLGYAALLVGFGVMVFFDRTSAAIFGGLLALVYASGRGGDKELEYDLVSDTGIRAAEAAEELRRPPQRTEPEDATPAASR
jgi:hypothetical protein